jgi:hypothetical protein
VWIALNAGLAAGVIVVYALAGNRGPYAAGGGVAGYALGIASLALIVAAGAYWGREQHAPETWRASPGAASGRPSAALAQTRERLADLQAEAAKAERPSFFVLRWKAWRILRAAGLSATYRVIVRRDAEGRPRIRMEAQDPLNALSNWLVGHQYLGVLALVAAGLHCGFRMQSPVGVAAMALLALVVLSGLAGTVIYYVAARRLTTLEAALRAAQPPDPARLAAQRARWEAAMKVWVYVHTPLTVALLVVVAAHVVAVLYY